MHRHVSAQIEINVTAPARLVLQVAVARPQTPTEELHVTSDGNALDVREVDDLHGTRLHVIDAPVGHLEARYTASVSGRSRPEPTPDADPLRYLRPSRYAESDSLSATARAEFAGLAGDTLLEAVSSWVGTRLAYVPGSSRPTDGAVNTLLARQGVCRDFAHLVVALLRALDVPARLVAVYAPGLDPMDFHAVAEAYVGGRWLVVDATTLAPRPSLLRISTGRDAADTAFLSVYGGAAELTSMTVTATVDVLPDDDVREAVELG